METSPSDDIGRTGAQNADGPHTGDGQCDAFPRSIESVGDRLTDGPIAVDGDGHQVHDGADHAGAGGKRPELKSSLQY